MKKILKYILPIAAVSALLVSCTEDNGNYNYTEISDIKIDTTGMNRTILGELNIGSTISDFKPTVTYGNGTENLEYAWVIYPFPYNQVQDGNDMVYPPADTICRTQSLEWTVDVTPNSYYLNFFVRDPETDLSAIQSFGILTFSSAGYRSGIYCLSEYDGKTDIDVFGTTLGLVIGGQHMNPKYLSASTGSQLEGNPLFLMACTASNSDKWVYVFTDQAGYRFNSTGMELMDNFDEMFYQGVEYDPQAMMFTNNAHFLLNAGKLHVLYVNQTNDRKFSAPIVGDYDAYPYLQKNTMTSWNHLEGAIDAHQLIYDKSSKAFRPYYPMQSSLASFSPTAVDAYIDVNNMPGTIKAIFEGNARYTYCITEIDGQHYLYIISIFNVLDDGDLSAIGAGSIVNLQYCQDIASATLFSGTNAGTAMYYATSQKVHSYAWAAGGTTPSTEIYSCAAGEEITSILVQDAGGWPTGGYVLWVAVWNESEKVGKILEYEVDAASGKPQQVWGPMFGATSNNPNIYTGTGKVKAMSMSHY